jgi:hypothetical protein
VNTNPPNDGACDRTRGTRDRMFELAQTGRRHPGYDASTVCSCAECVLWTLLDTVLSDIEWRERERVRFDAENALKRWPDNV